MSSFGVKNIEYEVEQLLSDIYDDAWKHYLKLLKSEDSNDKKKSIADEQNRFFELGDIFSSANILYESIKGTKHCGKFGKSISESLKGEYSAQFEDVKNQCNRPNAVDNQKQLITTYPGSIYQRFISKAEILKTIAETETDNSNQPKDTNRKNTNKDGTDNMVIIKSIKFHIGPESGYLAYQGSIVNRMDLNKSIVNLLINNKPVTMSLYNFFDSAEAVKIFKLANK